MWQQRGSPRKGRGGGGSGCRFDIFWSAKKKKKKKKRKCGFSVQTTKTTMAAEHAAALQAMASRLRGGNGGERRSSGRLSGPSTESTHARERSIANFISETSSPKGTPRQRRMSTGERALASLAPRPVLRGWKPPAVVDAAPERGPVAASGRRLNPHPPEEFQSWRNLAARSMAAFDLQVKAEQAQAEREEKVCVSVSV